MTTQPTYHVAQFNFGILIDDWDTPTIAEFQDNLDLVNDLAERSDGFVWRMSDEDMEAEQLDPERAIGGNPRMASTMSVWQSAHALDHFVTKTLHGAFMKKRAQWFEKHTGPSHVVWPIEIGTKPTISEALMRLKMLGDSGPSSEAYDLMWHRQRADHKEALNA